VSNSHLYGDDQSWEISGWTEWRFSFYLYGIWHTYQAWSITRSCGNPLVRRHDLMNAMNNYVASRNTLRTSRNIGSHDARAVSANTKRV
jgi:hypothetical protein